MNPLLTAVAVEVLAPAARSIIGSLVGDKESEEEFEGEPEGLREERNRADIADARAAEWCAQFQQLSDDYRALEEELRETMAERDAAQQHARQVTRTLQQVFAGFEQIREALYGVGQ